MEANVVVVNTTATTSIVTSSHTTLGPVTSTGPQADIILGRDGLRILEFWKNWQLSYGRRKEQLSFSDPIISDQFGSQLAEMSWDLRQYKMHHAWRRDKQSMLSIGSYELFLTPHVTKGWKQKEINPPVLVLSSWLYNIYIDLVLWTGF